MGANGGLAMPKFVLICGSLPTNTSILPEHRFSDIRFAVSLPLLLPTLGSMS
jgi:hypothetical protein